MNVMEQAALRFIRNMTGMTETEMQSAVYHFINMANNIETRMANMEAKIDEIHQYTFPSTNNPKLLEDKTNVKNDK